MKSNLMYRLALLALGVCATSGILVAQRAMVSDAPKEKKWPLVVTVFNTGTQLPGSGVAGVFTLPMHPGISAGTEFRYNKKVKNQWFQTAKAGVSWHRYVQTAVQLYSETGYRRAVWRGVAAELRLGAGYLHSIPGTELFEAKNGGYQEKSRFGRPQIMASGAFGLSYTLPRGPNPPRFFVDYQFLLQMPFVKSYVPLLPNTALHLGVGVPLFK